MCQDLGRYKGFFANKGKKTTVNRTKNQLTLQITSDIIITYSLLQRSKSSSKASSADSWICRFVFQVQYLLVALRSPSSFLCLILLFPPFLPFPLFFLQLCVLEDNSYAVYDQLPFFSYTVCIMFLPSLTPSNTSSLTRSIPIIFLSLASTTSQNF